MSAVGAHSPSTHSWMSAIPELSPSTCTFKVFDHPIAGHASGAHAVNAITDKSETTLSSASRCVCLAAVRDLDGRLLKRAAGSACWAAMQSVKQSSSARTPIGVEL